MIYLDHAATSHPKSPAVRAAVLHWFDAVGASAARGAGTRTLQAAREVATARAAVGELVGCPAERIAFTSGATEGLNLALRALLPVGCRVLTTAFEHSSVVRPLRALQRERGLSVDVLPPSPDGRIDVDAARAALATRPTLFVFTHASNVTGAVLDASTLTAAARAHGVTTLLDASQTAGLLDLRVGADLVVASAHKALGAPPGLGFVAALTRTLAAQKQGGTGSGVAGDEHPEHWPDAFEAGTPNTPAIYGLAAALRDRTTVQRADDLASALARSDELAAGLAELGWRTFGPRSGPRVPVVSATHASFDPAELGALLAGIDVQVRTGHHCAPWLHEHLGTTVGGTVRFSPGPDTTAAQVATVLAFLHSVGAG